jgi:simple sugar transport system permease protein
MGNIPAARNPDFRMGSFLLHNRNSLISCVLLAGFFILFSSTARGFFSFEMLTVILLTGAELATLTIGVTILIIAGEIDLSIASVFVFSNYVVLLLSGLGVPLPISALLALAFGFAAGFLNGFLTLRFKIPSFVVTLGTLIFWRSAVAGLTNGEPMYYAGDVGKSIFLKILGGQIGIFPAQFLWFLGFAVLFALILSHTRFGNHIFATGGSSEIAKALGVNSDRTKMTCFVISGMLAAFAGVSFLARSSYLDPIVGTGMEFEAVAATVIGGTILTGGSGSIFSAVVCALLLKELQIGAGAFGVKTEYYKVVVGALLVVAAVFNMQITRRVFRS